MAYSDRGTNLTSAAKEGGVQGGGAGGDDDDPAYDWDSIEGSTRGKTSWSFHPPGSQFRNGAVEIMVKKFKRTLEHKFSMRLMFMLELQTSFKIVASILNSRPIYARWGNRGLGDPDYLSALTPNMLLTGRVNTEVPVRDYVTSDKPLCRMKYVEECVAQWWNQFMSQNFSSLVPRQKWQFERRNMREGDVVLISYEGKCRPATYRLGVVVNVVVDDDQLVRTVVVEYSLLAELPVADRLAYKGVTKKRITVAVQRLCLILPVEEREEISSSGGQAGGDPPAEVSGNDVQQVVDSAAAGQAALGESEHGGGGEVGYQGIGVAAKGRDCLRIQMKSCLNLEGRVKYMDYEGGIYKAHSEQFDWKVIFGDIYRYEGDNVSSEGFKDKQE